MLGVPVDEDILSGCTERDSFQYILFILSAEIFLFAPITSYGQSDSAPIILVTSSKLLLHLLVQLQQPEPEVEIQ